MRMFAVLSGLSITSNVIFSREYVAANSVFFLQSITQSILVSRRARPSSFPHKMSYTPSGRERDKGQQREGRKPYYYGSAETPRTYQPSGQRAERHLEDPGRSEVTPETQLRYYTGGQHSAHPLQRTNSSGREEKRRPPPQRLLDWQNERPFTDPETVPAQRRNEVRHTKKETRVVEQPTNQGARVHFQQPVHRRPRTPEDADEEGVSGSSTDDSLEGSLTIVEKDDGRRGDRDCALSQSLDVIEDEGARTSDEEGYVYVPRRLPLSRRT